MIVPHASAVESEEEDAPLPLSGDEDGIDESADAPSRRPSHALGRRLRYDTDEDYETGDPSSVSGSAGDTEADESEDGASADAEHDDDVETDDAKAAVADAGSGKKRRNYYTPEESAFIWDWAEARKAHYGSQYYARGRSRFHTGWSLSLWQNALNSPLNPGRGRHSVQSMHDHWRLLMKKEKRKRQAERAEEMDEEDD